MMAKAGAGAESERRNNNHNGERRGEIGEQMNRTIRLGARAEGQVKQKGCEDGGPQTERKAGGNQARLNREKRGNSAVRKR